MSIAFGTGESAVAQELERRGWLVDRRYARRADPPDLVARKDGTKWRIEVKTCTVDRLGASKRPKETIDFQFKARDWIAADVFVLCLKTGGEIKDFLVMRKDEAPVGPIVKVTNRVRFFMNQEHLRYPDWAQHLNRFDKLD